MLYETCLRCGRKLKSQESKELGFGKVCWEKYNAEDNYKPLFTIGENTRCTQKHKEQQQL